MGGAVSLQLAEDYNHKRQRLSGRRTNRKDDQRTEQFADEDKEVKEIRNEEEQKAEPCIEEESNSEAARI